MKKKVAALLICFMMVICPIATQTSASVNEVGIQPLSFFDVGNYN